MSYLFFRIPFTSQQVFAEWDSGLDFSKRPDGTRLPFFERRRHDEDVEVWLGKLRVIVSDLRAWEKYRAERRAGDDGGGTPEGTPPAVGVAAE